MRTVAASASQAPSGWWLALRALRAPHWLHFALLPAATASSPSLSQALPLAQGMAVAALALAYAYGLNALADRPTDLDPRKNPLSAALPLPLPLYVLLFSVAATAIALAALAGAVALAALATSLTASTIYSVGPRLKDLPVIGTLSNAAIFAPLLVVAPLPLPAQLGLVTSLFVALVLQNQLLHERADHDEDVRAGTLTTARMLGPKATRAGVALLGAGGIGVTFLLARSTFEAAAAVAALLVVTTVVLTSTGTAAALRVRHRRWAVLAGAVVFAVTR